MTRVVVRGGDGAGDALGVGARRSAVADVADVEKKLGTAASAARDDKGLTLGLKNT